MYGQRDTMYLRSEAELANEHIARVEPVEQPQGLVLQVWLTGEGASRLFKVTSKHIGDRLAVLIISSHLSRNDQ